jgi:D-alanyl-D-alanine dipeptidase
VSNKIIQIVDCGEKLVDIPSGFLVEPMYFNAGFSRDSSMRLRSGIVEKLAAASHDLPTGLRFKIWDGFRPLYVQEKLYNDLWELRKKENPEWDDSKLKVEVEKFVAFPSYDKSHPSPHNTGGAVDLTLVSDDGTELPMGTPFDEFHERSYSDYFKDAVDEEGSTFHKNREILRSVMMKHGFAPYFWEWWHFSFGDYDAAEYFGKEVAVYGSCEL